MKNALLTFVLIVAAVASGDLLAQATVAKKPAARVVAAVTDKASQGSGDGRSRSLVAVRVASATTAWD